LDKKVVFPVSRGQEVTLSFVSENSIESGDGQDYFVYSFEPGTSLESMPAKLVLPEGALLASPAEEGSVLPAPENIFSDGRRLEIGWSFAGGETIFVSFIPPVQEAGLDWVILPAIIVLALAAIVVIWLSKDRLGKAVKKKGKAKKETPKAKEKKAEKEKELDLRGLTPEEKDVVMALHKNPEKQLTQSRLKDLTGLSKVKLSRVIARLEKREVVGKRPYGNTNLIFLPKKD
jgi:uncharacterized membrane protein